ncbi:major capsid protein [Gordonia sp. HY285]|uniref:major capsid protein n=1 Tax=Gordonia liuliyuniae TaxID=2911517 RepID=UPI001F265CE5|nr:major capsid protein [Gordonia liuliyuniae]MCF8610057.1 major capsid protein [Gordonia liuliyuniae]
MKLDLQAILDAAHNAGASAEDRIAAIKSAITEANPERAEVDTLVSDAVGKFNELNESDPTDADSIHGLELLTAIAVTARDVQGEMDAEVERVRSQRDELAAKVNGTEEAPAETPEGEAPAEAEATTEEAPAATDGGDAAGAEVVAEAEAAVADAATPVTAAGAPSRRFVLRNVPQHKSPAAKDSTGVAITAAADVRGFATGQDLEGMDGLVAAALARVEAMPRGLEGAYVKAGVAQLRAEWPDSLVASAKRADAQIEFAASESRLKGGSLTASGGWCAPSERMYELTPMLADPNAGILSMPEIAVKRGGIETAGGVDFRTVWAGNAGLIRTEANEEADPYVEKALYRPECPEFKETRADVIYSGLQVGFLQDNAYPEVTKQTLEGLLAVHAHRVNASSISRIVALSDEVDLTTTIGPSATSSTLNGLGLVATDYRYGFRASPTLTLEAVAPMWLKEVIRADLSLRAGDGQYVQVNDAQIDGYFAARGVKVSWVYDWQDAFTTNPATGFGGETPLTGFPDEVNVLVYAAGTFVRGRGDVVNLDTVYDSQGIKNNDFLSMFMEEKLLVHKRAHKALNVTIPVAVNGTTGTGLALDHNGLVAASGE